MMSTIPFVTFAVLERYDNYLEQLEYEAQRIANEPKPGERSYIEPELKAKLEAVELDLREKVRQLHQDLPPSSYAVNLDHQTKEIEVIVENKQLIPKIEEITIQYPDDIPIVIAYGKFGFGELLLSKFSDQQCADQFDELLEEEKDHVPCNSSTDEAGNVSVCEPVGRGWNIMNNDTFNQTGCPLNYKDWAYLTDDNDLVHGIYSPRYEIEMDKTNLERYIPISIEKWGFDACDSLYLRIINHDNRDETLSFVAYEKICAQPSEQIKRQKFVYDLEPLELPRGNYVVYLYDKDPREIIDIDHFEELTKFYFSSHFGTGPVIELDAIKQTNPLVWIITGRTTDVESEIILNLYNPENVFVTRDIIAPDHDGEFSTVITAGGPLFKSSGHYKITLQQGDAAIPQVSRLFDVIRK